MPHPPLPHISSYERMTGGCTRLLAAEMISFSPPIDASSYILDNACGPGIVTSEIKSRHPPARIMAADLAPAMTEEVQTSVQMNGWSNVETATLDIRSLDTLKDESFTHVFANLALPVPRDPLAGVEASREMFRVLKPRGVAMVSTWADRVWPAAFARTSLRVRPSATPSNAMAMSAEYYTASWLLQQLEQGGFKNNVEIRPVVTCTSAASLEELADNMFMAKGMFFPGFDEEELVRAKVDFKEEMRSLRTYEEGDWGVRVGMKAWIGIGWKKGDEEEVVC